MLSILTWAMPAEIVLGGSVMTDENKAKTNAKKTGTRKQTGAKTVQKETSTNEHSQGVQQDEQQVVIMMPDLTEELKRQESGEPDISSYVSNEDKNVYAITGLPEEFIATLFAWVSRSPKSFREHLKIAAKEFQLPALANPFLGLNKKAKDFHEKWTVGYGHSSVAEHATAHVGIENISRLASAELELANSFLSITEYSQRYQKPERGKWTNPMYGHASADFDYGKGNLHDDIEAFYEKTFDVFEQLIDGVYASLKEKYHQSEEFKTLKAEQTEKGTDIKALEGIDKKLKMAYSALKKLAFEDARYVLPLAMHTQLGMTANGRAWRDALAQLGNSEHAESKELAEDLREEITKVLPVLLKYATPSQYQVNSKKRVSEIFKEENSDFMPPMDVQLLSVPTQSEMIDKIVALLDLELTNNTYSRGKFVAEGITPRGSKEDAIARLLFEMKHFDMAPDVFKHIRYDAAVNVSEANWHQLLRHNRMTDFTFGKPSPFFGIKIPPRIVEAGLADLVKDIAQQSRELYNKLVEEGYESEAQYVVLNAHKRQVFMSFSLWEAYHLINLRTSDEAQWDIRETFEQLHKQLTAVHPHLFANAKRRD